MIIADASVLVSALWPDDPNHETTLAWLAEYGRSKEVMIAPGLILAEVAGPITRRTGSAELGRRASAQILAIPRFTTFQMTDTIWTLAAELAADLRLRGADAIYVALAAYLDAPLVTWDQEQAQRGAQRVTTWTPDQ